MHRWDTICHCTGPRGAVVLVRVCRQCGMMWNSQTRRPVPICWGPRYVPPNWRHWWSDFNERLAAWHRGRISTNLPPTGRETASTLEQQQEHHQCAAADRPGQPWPVGRRWGGRGDHRRYW